MIRLYVFLLDFLIPFLCDPDLQCRVICSDLYKNLQRAKKDSNAIHIRKNLRQHQTSVPKKVHTVPLHDIL